jgi:uncharacterized protein
MALTLPFDLSLWAMGWMAIACIVAGFVRGYSGFGFSAMIVAASGLVTNPLNFVAVVVILETVMSVQAWERAGPDVDWKRTGWLLAGAAIGAPLGLWALTGISEDAARAAISIYVLAMCVILLVGFKLAHEVRGRGVGRGQCAGHGWAAGGGLLFGAAYASGGVPGDLDCLFPAARPDVSATLLAGRVVHMGYSLGEPVAVAADHLRQLVGWAAFF